MLKLIVLNALSGAFAPAHPTRCSMSEWDNVEGDYNTYGEADDYETGAPAAMQRGGQLRPAQRAAPLALAPRAAPRAAPARPTQSAGPTIAQVQALIAQQVNARTTAAQVEEIARRIIAQRVPYNDVPPRPNSDEAMFPMGLGSVTLTSIIPTAVLAAAPQRAFRGERLVLTVQRSSGATGVIALLTEFNIGDYKQLIGGGSQPVDVFANDSFGVRLMLDASTPGVLYSLTVSATVPAGEFVIVAGSVIGRAGEAAQR